MDLSIQRQSTQLNRIFAIKPVKIQIFFSDINVYAVKNRAVRIFIFSRFYFSVAFR